jgi:ketosteroid isomerase-like protein
LHPALVAQEAARRKVIAERFSSGFVPLVAGLLLLVSGSVWRSFAQQRRGSIAALIERKDKEFAQVLVHADLGTLDQTFAESYVFTDPTGRVSGKRELMDSFRNGAIQIQSQEITDVKVQAYGNVAIETGQLTSKATRDGRDSSGTFRFTRVWVNRVGGWQTVAFQETRTQ